MVDGSGGGCGVVATVPMKSAEYEGAAVAAMLSATSAMKSAAVALDSGLSAMVSIRSVSTAVAAEAQIPPHHVLATVASSVMSTVAVASVAARSSPLDSAAVGMPTNRRRYEFHNPPCRRAAGSAFAEAAHVAQSR